MSIINNSISGDIMSSYFHKTLLSFSFLIVGRQELSIKCPYEAFDNSPIPASKFYLMQKSQFKNTNIEGIEKDASRLALGCDNQTSSLLIGNK